MSNNHICSFSFSNAYCYTTFFLPFFLFSSSLFFLFLNLKSFNLPFATLVGSRLRFFSKPICIHPHLPHRSTEAHKYREHHGCICTHMEPDSLIFCYTHAIF